MAIAGEHTDSSTTVTVLVIDDEPGAATLIAQLLERADPRIDVTTETDPETGLALAREADFDCIVSDYHMPGMDGLALLRCVDEFDQDVDRILHTNDDDVALRNAAENADVRYVYKRMTISQYEEMADRIRQRVTA